MKISHTILLIALALFTIAHAERSFRSSHSMDPVGFAAATVLSTPATKTEDPIGKFVVPNENAPGVNFPDLSMKNTADNSIIPGMTATINGQQVGNIIKNALMGEDHPAIWNPTHCIQTPFLVNNAHAVVDRNCHTTTGYYMDVPTGVCQPITVTCDQTATLNFFPDLATCQQMCVNAQGKPMKVQPTKVNLNPEQSCIQQPVTKMGKSKTMQVVYSYDSVSMTCWKYKVPKDSSLSVNVYLGANAGAVCEHMCHRVGPAGSGVEISLQNPIPGLPSVAHPVEEMSDMLD